MIGKVVYSVNLRGAFNFSQQFSHVFKARDARISDASVTTDSEAGAAGTETGPPALSREGMIAICVVGAGICVFGVISAILFYHAQKRDWQIRENLRKSARRVTTALTPRRSKFPNKATKTRSSWGLTIIEELPTSVELTHDDGKHRSKIREFVIPHINRNSLRTKKYGKRYSSV